MFPEILIKTMLYQLILDLPFDGDTQIQMRYVAIETVPQPLRDIVQMYQSMNPECEADVRQEMKAALVDLLAREVVK
jgi:hypothetical protein